MNTAVIEIRVDDTIKGNPVGSLYVEYVRGAIGVDVLSKDMPTDIRMLFLLRNSEGHLPSDVYKFEGEGRGRPAGEPLYYFSLPAGIVGESSAGAGVEYPLGDGTEVVFEGSTLGEVEASVREIVRKQGG